MTPPAASAGAARLRSGAAAPAPLRHPPAPRRLSGPARHPRAQSEQTAGRRVLLALIDHPWLERLVRGRAWIAIVASALLGIVAMQVALLRLGAQIGSETSAVNVMTERITASENAIADIEASRGVASEAANLGMVYPPAGAVTFLQPNPGDAQRAADTMAPPSAAATAVADEHPIRVSASTTALTAPPATTGATGGSAPAAATAKGGASAGTATTAGGDTGSATSTTTAGDAASTVTTSSPTTTTTTGAGSATTTAQTGSGALSGQPATTTAAGGTAGAPPEGATGP